MKSRDGNGRLIRSSDQNLNTLGDDEDEQERFEPVDISISSEDMTENYKNSQINDSQNKLASYDGEITSANINSEVIKKRTRRARK